MKIHFKYTIKFLAINVVYNDLKTAALPHDLFNYDLYHIGPQRRMSIVTILFRAKDEGEKQQLR